MVTTGPVSVIGAGPAGLGAAYELARSGVQVVVYERGPHVGGLGRSVDLWGHKVEFGAHLLLREDPRIDQLWNALIGEAYVSASRDTRVISGDRWFRYPYQPIDVLRALGVRQSARCVAGMLRRPTRDDADLESWIVSRFGRPAYELLVSDYLRKLFGVPASELHPDLSGSLLGFDRHPSLTAIMRRMVRGAPEPPVVKPHGGVGELLERLAAEVVRLGGLVELEADIGALRIERGGICGIHVNGESRATSHVISTAPLPILIGSMTDAPSSLHGLARTLRARSVVIVYVLVDGPSPFPGQWIYIADPRAPVSRITNFSGWDAPLPETVLAFEMWCDPSDAVWGADPNVLRLTAEQALRNVGLRAPRSLEVAVIRRRHVFPVLSRDYRTALATLQSWIDSIQGLSTTGRFGRFANSGVHESMLMGMDSAQELLIRD